MANLKNKIEMDVLHSLDQNQKLLFMGEMNARRKKTSTGLLLTLFLGGLGAHHFYYENVFSGVLYLLFFWTFIPACLALLELLFCVSFYTESYNERLAQQISTKLTYAMPVAKPADAP